MMPKHVVFPVTQHEKVKKLMCFNNSSEKYRFLFWKSCFLCHPEKLVNRPVNFHPVCKNLKGTEPHFCKRPLQNKSKSGNWEIISCEVKKGSKVLENCCHIPSTLQASEIKCGLKFYPSYNSTNIIQPLKWGILNSGTRTKGPSASRVLVHN